MKKTFILPALVLIKGLKIKVVIRQVDGGTKHFFSIMGSGIKKSPSRGL
ncbi:hypothetical protein HY085_03745 [Candidatus Gottesmanbacteria bacterium]|nr:hypothetical protein [Candidatus Gottesmanbacteria bacterium]